MLLLIKCAHLPYEKIYKQLKWDLFDDHLTWIKAGVNQRVKDICQKFIHIRFDLRQIIIYRYAVGQNKYLKYHDENKNILYIMYWNASNVTWGGVTCCDLPADGFELDKDTS